MKILNFGSLNLDYVYAVDHMVGPGETIASAAMEIFCGGKGLNQSIALAKAGAAVYHAGLIGEEGQILKEACQGAGVNCQYIKTVPGRSGHTIIQVDKAGQNCILLYGGANRAVTTEFIDDVLADFDKGDVLLLQNEINKLDEIVEKAYTKKMMIVLNPSPFDDNLKAVDMNKISMFLLNEVEGEQLTGEVEPEKILEKINLRYPHAKVVLTFGSEGSIYQYGEEIYRQGIYEVKAVDTTAAGDTFTGYFLASVVEGMTVAEGLDMAAKAAAIAVSRPGAAPSIPLRSEVTAD